MATYIAHYISPAASDARGAGYFEFESEARANSKENLRDARLTMLELLGKDAVSYNIDSVKLQSGKSAQLNGQLELDFRPEKKQRRRKTKEYW